MSEITVQAIYEKGLCPKGLPVKVLGRGEVSSAVTVEAHRFSGSAKESYNFV